uniref:RUN domain-containing protein n=1 Tax=Heterorhabditis bacteriophora TaxID=37862 RepID=A0A1I7XQ37_HETBA
MPTVQTSTQSMVCNEPIKNPVRPDFPQQFNLSPGEIHNVTYYNNPNVPNSSQDSHSFFSSGVMPSPSDSDRSSNASIHDIWSGTHDAWTYKQYRNKISKNLINQLIFSLFKEKYLKLLGIIQKPEKNNVWCTNFFLHIISECPSDISYSCLDVKVLALRIGTLKQDILLWFRSTWRFHLGLVNFVAVRYHDATALTSLSELSLKVF